MILTNIESVPGRHIVEHFGIVSGSTVRAKHVGRDFMAGLKNIVGGELKGYTELLQDSRQEATQRMIEKVLESPESVPSGLGDDSLVMASPLARLQRKPAVRRDQRPVHEPIVTQRRSGIRERSSRPESSER